VSVSNFNPQNTQFNHVVKFFALLELEKNEHFSKISHPNGFLARQQHLNIATLFRLQQKKRNNNLNL
jgi:hypothetical protein